METEQKFSFSSWLRSPTDPVLVAFLAIAAFYLVIEHTAHVFGFLPRALLLLCSLLYLFMHRGHGGHGVHGENAEAPGSGLAVDMPARPRARDKALQEAGNESRISRLRPLATRHYQRDGVRHLRLQLYQTAHRCDWRSFSAFSAFLVALFTEMYGFPLTIYLLSGWLVATRGLTCFRTTAATYGKSSSADGVTRTSTPCIS